MLVTVIAPTFNESANIAELIHRIDEALRSEDAELIIVDDSADDTVVRAQAAAASASIPVRVIHREEARGGLGGAVLVGLEAARGDLCVVMDADLQHPPERILALLERQHETDADVVVASRYAGGGSSRGLADRARVAVSRVSTLVTRAMFPIRLRGVTDPMTGFFLVRRDRIDLDSLRPRGFKILLEILARQDLRVVETPFDFGARVAGDSKASFRQGLQFLLQLMHLRFGRMSLFALIGGLGAVVNVGLVWILTLWGMPYIWAAVIAAELTIVGNFLLIERFVFHDLREEAAPAWRRFLASFAFNNVEALVRIPLMALMVENWHVSAVLATAVTLVAAFFVRFVFHALVVYAPRKTVREVDEALAEIDRQPVERQG